MVDRVEAVGARAHVIEGELQTVIGAIGDREHVANLELEGAAGVDHLVPISRPTSSPRRSSSTASAP